ncbi:hypothetical protein QWZ13_16040 [Reinekea marina]|uniref:Uncharacterized protein n=1 Tax=Reinekea marina TaxID=1310421 RepID=A0ABV7WQA9_9GAMM|nr:hypothetical protein [Reinekea marina]MDN3650419.1 hypothetical protein [Reinekea marina]
MTNTYIQKKGAIKHTFTLKDDLFNFAYEEKRGSGDTDFNYADLPLKSSIQIEQNEWLRNVGYLWIAVGALQLFYSQTIFWLVIGVGCVAWAVYSKIKYTVYRTERGNVFIIQNDQSQALINELFERRSAQLLKWYGDINAENTLENEVKKFNWLVEQGALSKLDADKKIAQAELLMKDEHGISSDQLN